MSTIILNREAAKLLVDVALSAMSRDEITPVICGAHVTVEDGKLRVVSTDRYRIHTALVEAKTIDGEVDAILPRAAIEWLSKNHTYYGGSDRHRHVIRIEIEPHETSNVKPVRGSLSMIVSSEESDAADRVTWSGRHTAGNFPPLMRLIETARASEPAAATPSLNMAFVGSINRIARFGGYAQVKFTTSENPNKPAPVYFAVKEGDAIVAEALLQPQGNLR